MLQNDNRITYNITYYAIFKNVRKILEELHILLWPDGKRKKVIPDIPIFGFEIGESLKDHLIRLVLPKAGIACNSVHCGR